MYQNNFQIIAPQTFWDLWNDQYFADVILARENN